MPKRKQDPETPPGPKPCILSYTGIPAMQHPVPMQHGYFNPSLYMQDLHQMHLKEMQAMAKQHEKEKKAWQRKIQVLEKRASKTEEKLDSILVQLKQMGAVNGGGPWDQAVTVNGVSPWGQAAAAFQQQQFVFYQMCQGQQDLANTIQTEMKKLARQCGAQNLQFQAEEAIRVAELGQKHHQSVHKRRDEVQQDQSQSQPQRKRRKSV